MYARHVCVSEACEEGVIFVVELQDLPTFLCLDHELCPCCMPDIRRWWL